MSEIYKTLKYDTRSIIVAYYYVFLKIFADQQITAILQRRLTEAFDDFAQDVLKSCDYEPAAATLPLKVTLLSDLCNVLTPSVSTQPFVTL